MDFHSLARRQLQCLCKQNKIPANITNLAMADALSALQHVEGLEELMKPSKSDAPQSPVKVIESKTSAIRKPIREVQVSQPRRTRTTVGKGDEENKDANVLKTPAMPGCRRRAPAASACPSLNAQIEKDGEIVGQLKNGLPQTPAIASSRRRRAPAAASPSEQRVYSTRRSSVKLLETTMAELSLNVGGKSKIEDLDEQSEESSEVPNVVQEVETKDDTIESDMLTLEEMDNISVTNETQDNIQDQSNVCLLHVSEKDEKVDDEVFVTEVSSEANNLEEEVKILDEVSTVKSSLPQETEDLVKAEFVESNQLSLNASNDQGEYPKEACENVVSRDSNVDVGEDDEHGESDTEIEYVNEEKDNCSSSEVADEDPSDKLEQSLDPSNKLDAEIEYVSEEEKDNCGSKVADENPSDKLEQSLDVSEDMEGSNSESECADEEENDDGSKVSDEKASDITFEATDFPEDDTDVDYDLEVKVSDSENRNDELFDVHVMEADIFVKNKTPKCNQSKQTSPLVEVYIMEEAEFGVPSEKTPHSIKRTPFRAQLSGDDQVSGANENMPLADDVYQFPRPSQATLMKSSSKKQATTQEMPLLSDDKENAESKNRKVDDLVDLHKKSMGELKKMLKELTLNKKGGDKITTASQRGGKMRAPLQILSENQMSAAESEKH